MQLSRQKEASLHIYQLGDSKTQWESFSWIIPFSSAFDFKLE